MKSYKVLFLATCVLALASTRALAQVHISVINANFQHPDSGKVYGFDGKSTNPATDGKILKVLGWHSAAPDSNMINSGVEIESTTGGDTVYHAFLMGGDSGIYQIPGKIIDSTDNITLTVTAYEEWLGDSLKLELFYDDTTAKVWVPLVSKVDTINSTAADYSVSFQASNNKSAVGHKLGILIDNVTDSASWMAVRNVRLTNSDTSICDLPNYSFEQPDKGKINGWDNDGLSTGKGAHGIDVPGWTDDSLGTLDSGIEQGNYVTDGVYDGYMGGTPDPPIYDVSSYVIKPGDLFKLRVDAGNGYNAPGFHLEIGYYDSTTMSYGSGDSSEVTLAGSSINLNCLAYFRANTVPASAGKYVAVKFENKYSGWVDFDNVRLNRINPSFSGVVLSVKKTVVFGKVELTKLEDTTVTIANNGFDTLKIASITSSNSVFTVNPTTKILAPGQSFTDTIRFAPTALFGAAAKIIILSNAPTSPDTISVSGTGSPITGVDETGNQPKAYALSQNFPNPFNPTTQLKYSIKENGLVTLKVYDVLGQEVATLFVGQQTAGDYTATFDGSKLASGIYFYRLQAGSFSQTKKMILMK
jgi:hypothetical protein